MLNVLLLYFFSLSSKKILGSQAIHFNPFYFCTLVFSLLQTGEVELRGKESSSLETKSLSYLFFFLLKGPISLLKKMQCFLTLPYASQTYDYWINT